MNPDITPYYRAGQRVIEINVDDILGKMQYNYALLIFILSSVLLLYVLWNSFVRSPSKPIGIKQALKNNLSIENQLDSLVDEDIGIEPSIRVKKISRALDGHMIIPALALTVISLSYLLSF